MKGFRVERIGNSTLYLGDCRDILPTLQAGSVDMIWTDPPYGHKNGDGDWLARRHVIMGTKSKTKAKVIANDDADSMRAVVDAMLREAVRVLRPDYCCCCCCCGGGGPRPTFAWLAERMDRDGLDFFHSVIWDKLNPGVGWRYRRQHEMVMVAHRTGGKLAWTEGHPALPNIYSESKPRSDEHPNIKPQGLIARFIEAHTQRGGLVLDPFMGSGSTGVAAVAAGRQFVGIELDADYFDTACARIDAAQRQGSLIA